MCADVQIHFGSFCSQSRSNFYHHLNMRHIYSRAPKYDSHAGTARLLVESLIKRALTIRLAGRVAHNRRGPSTAVQ